MSEIAHYMKQVTPSEAKMLLMSNKGNRSIRRSYVRQYAADMRHGRWHVGTSAIVIDRNGTLIDGQHRLLACIEADVPFTTFILEGVEPEAKVGIDQGGSRQLSDVLAWRGHPRSSQLAAAVRAGWLWSKGDPFNRTIKPSHDEGIEWLDRNPSIEGMVSVAKTFDRQFHSPRGVTSAVLHRITLVEPDAAAEFIDAVDSGVNLLTGSPALALRSWLTGQSVLRPTAARRALAPVYQFVWVKAWNAHVGGRQVKLLRYVQREPFPCVLDGSGAEASMADEVDLTRSAA